MDKKVAGFVIAPLWNEFMNEILPLLSEESFVAPEESDNPFVELKPVLRNVWAGGLSHLIDTTTEKLATNNTPKEVLGEIVTGGVHSILHWVDSSDPNGLIPINPENDPQYGLWEYSVGLWVDTQNIPVFDEKDVPNELSEAHSNKNRPSVEIIIPDNIQIDSLISITLNIDSSFPISKVEYYLNNNYIGTSKQKPFSLTFTPKNAGATFSKNTLRVVVYDAVQNKTEKEASFNVSL